MNQAYRTFEEIDRDRQDREQQRDSGYSHFKEYSESSSNWTISEPTYREMYNAQRRNRRRKKQD